MARTGQDDALLQRVQEYDPAAISEIYDSYAGRIYNYIYYRLGNVALAEDLTGTVFVKMLEAIRADKSWNVSFSGWLYRIAHNLVVDHFRRNRESKNVPIEDTVVVSEHDPVKQVERDLDSERLRWAIGQLTEEQGMVVTLKFVDGFSNAEVASMMGKTEGAVKSLQFRAMASLRRILESKEQDG